ncbi:hypothetical protein IM40_11290 (plasmid) [Candidatus Paracaedimonas acanthamoebae]|nr:hypothetical protein IM40_11290 [Candidatus Paracaedimonas acanthamoebae]
MFVIFQNKEFYEELWDKHTTSDNLKDPLEFNLEAINLYDPKNILNEDLYLLCLDEEEGTIGKVTFSHSNNNSDIPINFDRPTTDFALIIRDVGYHIYADSEIHDDGDEFNKITYKFYQSIMKNASWICDKLSIKNIITISDHIDDHKDLAFWGGFKFLSHWEFRGNIIGILSSHDDNVLQIPNSETFCHSIKYISYDELI